MKFSILGRIKNNNWFFLSLILLVGLTLRLVVVNFFYHIDMLSIAYWGKWIFEHGPNGFYDNNVWVYSWPTQPPLVNLVYALGFWIYLNSLELFRNFTFYVVPHLAPGHMLWWFDFVKWYNDAVYPESDLRLGFLISIKFIGILADLLIGLIIFILFKNQDHKKALLIATIFLLSPFSFYLSSIWGQFDSLSFLFLLLAFIFLLKKKPLLAPLIFMVSVSLKPTALMFLPLFLWVYFQLKGKWWEYLIGIAISLFAFFATVAVFTDKNLIEFTTRDLMTKIFFKSGFRVSTNSFNFWHILIGNQAREHFVLFLGLPAYFWGFVSFIITNFIAFGITKKISQQSLFTALTIVGLAGWLFMINMLERYFYSGIVFMLILTFYYPKILKYWLVLSIIFWLNLYHGWWVPREWDFLRRALIWNEHTLTRILSAINVGIFFKFFYDLKINPLKYFTYLKRVVK